MRDSANGFAPVDLKGLPGERLSLGWGWPDGLATALARFCLAFLN